MRSSPLIAIVSLAVLLPLGFGNTQARSQEVSLAQRRERLEKMSDVEKTRLLQKKRRFDELSPEEQDHLRQLYHNLAADPHYEHLRGVLERYTEWLKTLTPVEKAELMKLPPQERMTHIKKLVSDQDAKRFRMIAVGFLNPEDLGAIRKWFDEFVKTHADEIRATVPKDGRFDRLRAGLDSSDTHECVRLLRFWYLRHPGPNLPQPTQEEVQRLKTLVSQDARETLDTANDYADKLKIIRNWCGAADFSSHMPPPVSQEELDRFVKEDLSESERAFLESLPRDKMYRELHNKYFQRRFRKPGMRMGPRGRRGSGGGLREFDRQSPGERGSDRYSPGGPGSFPLPREGDAPPDHPANQPGPAGQSGESDSKSGRSRQESREM